MRVLYTPTRQGLVPGTLSVWKATSGSVNAIANARAGFITPLNSLTCLRTVHSCAEASRGGSDSLGG